MVLGSSILLIVGAAAIPQHVTLMERNACCCIQRTDKLGTVQCASLQIINLLPEVISLQFSSAQLQAGGAVLVADTPTYICPDTVR
jgi:hypothetical protein